MQKALLTTFILMLCVVAGCTHNQQASSAVTIQEVLDEHSRDLIAYHEIGDKHFLLELRTEFKVDANLYNNQFVMYNLSTGESDPLHKDAEYWELSEIVDENELIFLSTGKNHINNDQNFPYIVRVVRDGNDFVLHRETKHYALGEEINIEQGKPGQIKDILLTEGGLQVVFGPIEGEEAQFFAAYVAIPAIQITSADAHRLQITFFDTTVDRELLDLINTLTSHTILELKHAEASGNTILTLTLASEVVSYNVLREIISGLSKDDLPAFHIAFN